MIQQLVTIAHAAQRLDLAPYPILQAVEQGRIPGYRLGRTLYLIESDLPSVVALQTPRPA